MQMRRNAGNLQVRKNYNRGGVMDKTGYLRRQAEFCLRLSTLCSDEPVSQHLNALAARYHEEALRAEFNVPEDDSSPTAPNWH
jgi:hypothetical protein